MASADGQILDVESQFVLEIAIKNGLTQDEFNRIKYRPESIDFFPPETIKDRLLQLYDLVALMMIDGDININELSYCKFIAKRLGFNDDIVEKMVSDFLKAIAKTMAKEMYIQKILNNL